MTWDHIGKLSKDKIIKDLSNCSKIFPGDKDLIMGTNRFQLGITTLCNIEIQRLSTGALSIWSLGGTVYPRSIMAHIRTVVNDDMWTSPHLFSKDPISRCRKQCKTFGLQPTETSIMELLNSNVANLIKLQVLHVML